MTYKFFPNAYEPSTVEGIEGTFSYNVVEKAGLPHYDHTGNLRYFVEITEEKKNELISLRDEETKFKRRYADIKEPLQIIGWNVFSDSYYGTAKGLEIKVVINGREVSLYSRRLDETIMRAMYNVGYANLSLAVKSKDMEYVEYSAINSAFSYYNNMGNDNKFRNESFITSILNYLKENEAGICKEFGYKTKAEKQQTQVERTKAIEAEKIAFENAKPDDLVNSGFGYMVKKRDYAKAQKMGYDGIENL